MKPFLQVDLGSEPAPREVVRKLALAMVSLALVTTAGLASGLTLAYFSLDLVSLEASSAA
jgi:hypothetical protein